LVLSFWLQDPACGADEGQHDAFRGLLDDVASGTRIVESELRFEKEVVLRVSVEPRSSAQACG
jgi:hypothetical protein